ncbi:MAG: Asp-tRNA(Asn)/Glu-tRNA(Gln) amidotransferase subunit GatB [Patescibacteria group bacterium]
MINEKVIYQPVIGLEIHLQLKTKSKMFCSCKNEWLEERPNVNICPICLGHPAVLPAINQEAVRMALILGFALNGQIAEISQFDRKNYFYPDLPKGYQISQYNLPLIQNAWIVINNHRIRIKRIHLEEDTAKLIHTPDNKWSLLDFNRAGIPLLEIVTEPDITSPQEAKMFLRELQLLARYLDISWADMEKGQMRCDLNISLRPKKENKLYPKTEIKNLNSFKAVEESLAYEIKRQTKLWQEGRVPKEQSTRGWNEKRGITIEQRSKEEEMDYRYFPEPDLPILSLSKFNLEAIKQSLPELPIARRERFIQMYGFSPSGARILTDDKLLADFTEKVITELKAWLVSLETVEGSEQEIWQKNKGKMVKLVANWLVNRLIHLMNENKIGVGDLKITPQNFSEFIILIYEGKVSSTLAQQILEKMFFEGLDVDQAIQEGGLKRIDDLSEINKIIEKVIKNNPVALADYKKGKVNAIIYLIGQVMKETKGRANPDLVRKILEEKLNG